MNRMIHVLTFDSNRSIDNYFPRVSQYKDQTTFQLAKDELTGQTVPLYAYNEVMAIGGMRARQR